MVRVVLAALVLILTVFGRATAGSIVLVAVGLSHDLFETISLDELDTVVFVDLVDWYTLVLQSKEEVDELADLVRVVSLLLLQFFHLPLLLLEVNE